MFDLERLGNGAVDFGLLMISIGGLVELRKNTGICRCTAVNLRNGFSLILAGSGVRIYRSIMS